MNCSGNLDLYHTKWSVNNFDSFLFSVGFKFLCSNILQRKIGRFCEETFLERKVKKKKNETKTIEILMVNIDKKLCLKQKKNWIKTFLQLEINWIKLHKEIYHGNHRLSIRNLDTYNFAQFGHLIAFFIVS